MEEQQKDILYALATTYLYEKKKEKEWQSISITKTHAKGMLCGACMAYGVDIVDNNNSLKLIERKSKEMVLQINKDI